MSSIVFEGIFALFAAIGAATLVWLVIGIFIQPENCKGIHVYTVVAVRDGERNLKKVVNSLLWQRDMLPEEREIILCGDISDKVKDELVHVTGSRAEISVLACEEVGNYLKKQMSENAAGDIDEDGNNNVGGNC